VAEVVHNDEADGNNFHYHLLILPVDDDFSFNWSQFTKKYRIDHKVNNYFQDFKNKMLQCVRQFAAKYNIAMKRDDEKNHVIV
jgi:hypothetical protein